MGQESPQESGTRLAIKSETPVGGGERRRDESDDAGGWCGGGRDLGLAGKNVTLGGGTVGGGERHGRSATAWGGCGAGTGAGR